MPTASEELREAFPGMDAEAMDVLEKEGVKESKNGLFVLTREKLDAISDRAWKALRYMRDEWDFDIQVKEPPHDR
jgi:hypothetical protein